MSLWRVGFMLVTISVVAGFTALGAGQDLPKVAPPSKQPDKKAGKADEGPSPDADLDQLELAAMKGSPLSKVNGVSLDISVKVDRQFAGDNLVIEWQMSYDGPRQPLIILGPTLEKETSRTTQVVVYAVNEEKKAAWASRFWSPSQEVNLPPNIFLAKDTAFPKELFIEVQPRKQAKGTMTIPANKIRQYLAFNGADKFFDPKTPPRLFVELRHEPSEANARGEKHSLDAWTGKLHSDIVETPKLKTW